MGKRILALIGLTFGMVFALSSQAAACSCTGVNLLADCVEDGGGGYNIEYVIGTETHNCPDGTAIAYSLTISDVTTISGTFPSGSGPFAGSYHVQECGEYTLSGSVQAQAWPWTTVTFGPVAVTCTCNGGGGEGCTPGFWKNHLDLWPATGFSTDDDFDTVFGTNLFDPDITLGEAIEARGGGINKLARHGTAALLSAAHPDVDYPLTVSDVISAVQAGDSDVLANANELGCPIN